MGKPLCFLLLLIFKLSSLCAQDAVHVWLDHKGRVQLEQITGKPYEVSLWSNYRYHAEDGVYNILNHTIGGADSAVNIITIPRDTSMSYWRKRFYDFLGFDWDRWRFTFGYPDIQENFGDSDRWPSIEKVNDTLFRLLAAHRYEKWIGHHRELASDVIGLQWVLNNEKRIKVIRCNISAGRDRQSHVDIRYQYNSFGKIARVQIAEHMQNSDTDRYSTVFFYNKHQLPEFIVTLDKHDTSLTTDVCKTIEKILINNDVLPDSLPLRHFIHYGYNHKRLETSLFYKRGEDGPLCDTFYYKKGLLSEHCFKQPSTYSSALVYETRRLSYDGQRRLKQLTGQRRAFYVTDSEPIPEEQKNFTYTYEYDKDGNIHSQTRNNEKYMYRYLAP